MVELDCWGSGQRQVRLCVPRISPFLREPLLQWGDPCPPLAKGVLSANESGHMGWWCTTPPTLHPQNGVC